MADDQQGRQVALGRRAVRVHRRVVQAVGAPSHCGELDWLGHRDVLLVHLERIGRADPADLHHVGVERDHLPTRDGRARDEGDRGSPRGEGLDRVEGDADRRQLARGGIQHAQVVDSARRPAAGHPAVLQLDGVAGPEDPRGSRELGLQGEGRGQLAPAVEVPPAAAVRCEPKRPVRSPPRLDHRLLGPSCDVLGLTELAAWRHRGDPQVGAVPGHVGVVPGDPREPAPVRAWSRRREEVVPRRHHDLPSRTSCADAHDLVHDRRRATLAVRLPHAHHEARTGHEPCVRVADRPGARRLVRQRDRFGPCALPPQALVCPVREDHARPLDRVRAPAVLVHGRADREPRGCDLVRLAGTVSPHEDDAALLLRPALEPVDEIAACRDGAEPRPRGRDSLGGHRRAPGSVGSDHGHCRHVPAQPPSRSAQCPGAGGTSSAGLRSKNPDGTSQKPAYSTGITGQSSGRTT